MKEWPWEVIEAIAGLLFVIAALVRKGKTIERITQKLREWGDKHD